MRAPVLICARSQVEELLEGFTPDPGASISEAAQRALFVARRLQERAAQLQTPAERRQQAELDRMLATPTDKVTLIQITDQAFRSQNPQRAVDHLIHILGVQGIPRFFNRWDRALLKGFQSFGGYAPGVALPLVRDGMQKETANAILPAEKEILTRHLRARTVEGTRMNVNYLGEAILGEGEAAARLQEYLQLLQWPEVEVVSVKISTLYSQISALARRDTVATLCDRLEKLIRRATEMKFRRADGAEVSKFVYLDMEEYRDLELTAAAFMQTLDRPGLEHARAGIALQAYVPDSYRVLLRLQEWARRRVAAGRNRVTIRLVKGANMEMERVEASGRGWPQAPYKAKLETDANYRRMLHELMKPENLTALDVGVASHNLFELAYGLVLAVERDALDRVQFEMLEGMANHQRRALSELSRNVLLYAPACKQENFINAIGYLVRRLDENTGPDNFLRHAFKIEVDSPEWARLEKGFLDALALVPEVSDAPRRMQDRRQPPPPANPVRRGWQNFENEPDTDFSLPQHSEWAEELIARWEKRCGENAIEIPLVIAGEEMRSGAEWRMRFDPSRPDVVVARHREATEAEINRAVECAAADPDGWRSLLPRERFEILGRVASELRQARGDLMGAALADAGKTLSESDPEISEVVDFVEFYRASAVWWQELPTLRARPKGVVVVVPPWNFPIAIPGGGIAAALAAGNTVILKPASDAVLVAWQLCQCFWRAGISQRVLQFVPCVGGREGPKLVNHPKVNAVVLTGGTQTALTMLRANPRLALFAETGGKNATIVTALSDRDQAIKHILHSAFSHSGQKCSATSLLLLEAEVYDDADFRRTLCDAVQSLKVGSAWALDTKLGPLIRPPAGDLENALEVLASGEEWAVTPRNVADNPNLWSPGVKYGVRPGRYSHLTEFFGPVLSVMRFTSLTEAIQLVNQTGYGLTSGIESLDERECAEWLEQLRAGNLYVNRVTTGAVVLRQPFGGIGKSVFGPGMKAGGPNYVAQFMDFEDAPERGVHASSTSEPTGGVAVAPNVAREGAVKRSEARAPGATPEGLKELFAGLQKHGRDGGLTLEEMTQIETAATSYERNCREEFGQQHDHFRLIGQDNFRRYRSFSRIRIRFHAADTAFDLFARVCAAHVVGSQVTVSIPPELELRALKLLKQATSVWTDEIRLVAETDGQLAQAIREHQTDRVRYAAPDRVPDEVLRAAAEAFVGVVSTPVVAEGRLELLWYVQEQSISVDYHRYGNLGARAAEPRAETL